MARNTPSRFLDEEKYAKESSSSGATVTGTADRSGSAPKGGQSSGGASGGTSQENEFEDKVLKLVDLGFGREAVEQALKLFNGNEEQAAGFMFESF